jgi:hypothetical protein
MNDTLRNAIDSAPQLVTIKVSFVSLVIVNTNTIQNIIELKEKNLTNSLGYTGNIAVYHGGVTDGLI